MAAILVVDKNWKLVRETSKATVKHLLTLVSIQASHSREPPFSLGKRNKRAPDYLFLLRSRRKDGAPQTLRKKSLVLPRPPQPAKTRR